MLTLSTASGWRPCVPRTSGHQDHLGCKNTFIYKYSHSDNYCWRQTLNYHRGYYFVCFLAVLKTIGWGLKQRGASAVMWPLKKINYIYCKCIISTGMYSNILLFIANNYWWVSDIENDACFIYPEIFPSASFCHQKLLRVLNSQYSVEVCPLNIISFREDIKKNKQRKK